MDSRLQRSSCNFEACRENANAKQRVMIINIKIIIIFVKIIIIFLKIIIIFVIIIVKNFTIVVIIINYPCRYYHDYLACQARGGEQFSGLLQHRTRDLVVTP